MSFPRTSLRSVLGSLNKDSSSLLLGNGVPQEFDKNRFSYPSLLEAAHFDNHQDAVRRVFKQLRTSDFEDIVRSLDFTIGIAQAFSHGVPGAGQILKHMSEAREAIRNGLVRAIAAKHPDHRNQLNDQHCDVFQRLLRRFGKIFTTNYDLLLYWAILRNNFMQREGYGDGFGRMGNDLLMWPSYHRDRQNVYWLHGSLLFFRSGTGIEKAEGMGDGNVIDIVRDRMSNDNMPLVVAEGTSKQKMAAIGGNAYLQICYYHLERLSDTLVTIGFGFKKTDDHIIRAIARSRLTKLFVGFHDTTDMNQLMESINRLSEYRKDPKMTNRKGAKPQSLNVELFDTTTEPIWHE